MRGDSFPAHSSRKPPFVAVLAILPWIFLTRGSVRSMRRMSKMVARKAMSGIIWL